MPANSGAEHRQRNTVIKAMLMDDTQTFNLSIPRTLSLASLQTSPPTNCPPAAPVTDTAPLIINL